VAQIIVLSDQETLAATAADRFVALTRAAIEARHRTAVCLAGGTTPRRLYELLADPTRPWRTKIDWRRLHLFWGDERPVPPDHAQSNFGMAFRALIDHAPIEPEHIHRIRGELTDLAEAARQYQIEIGPYGPFDAVLLGIGSDGHIASIFPGSPLLDSSAARVPSPGERVAAVWVEQLGSWRITLTPQALLDARAVLVLVAGRDKAGAVAAALEGPEDTTRWPAQLLRRAGGRVEWLMDAAAAQRLAAPPA
jgi:6-phosphogluconolactonase